MRICVVLACLAACHSNRDPRQAGSAPEPSSAPAPPPREAPPAPIAQGDIARWVPLDKPFLATQISAVSNNRCAVSRAGQVACWGDLTNRQAGPVEIKAGLTTPRLLAGIEGATAVATNWFFVCVAQRADAGSGRCFATLDVGFKVPQFPAPPVELGPGPGSGICARMTDGKVGCIEAHGKYTPIAGIERASSFACSDDAMYPTCCATTPAGLACFGTENKPVGAAGSETVAKPVAKKLPAITALALDRGGACARTSTGGAECWGETAKLSRASGVKTVGSSYDGMCLVLDDGTLACKDKDKTPAVSHVVQIDRTCTVHDDGAIRCWGDNSNGELGDGSLSASATPVRVPGLDDVVDLQVAHTDACAVKRDKSLHCWGPSAVTEVGTVNGPLVPAQYAAGCRIDGARIACSTPTGGDDIERLSFTPNVGALKSAAIHRDSSVCAVDGSGRVTCQHGMAYNGIDANWRPLAAPGPVDELQPLATGFCARQHDGHVSCFVDHRYDDDEKFLDKPPPAPKLELVPKLEHVVQLATGQDAACAISASGDVACWETDHPHQPSPHDMPMLHGATHVAGNHLHWCALVKGEAWCWGENRFGQLGDGTSTTMGERAKAPVRAALPAEAVKIGVGRDSSCALLKTGQVWCWGANDRGQLGTVHRQRSDEPMRVVGIGPK